MFALGIIGYFGFEISEDFIHFNDVINEDQQ